MQAIISENIGAIAEACKMHHVKALYVFGSVVRDDFSEESDVDFMAEFIEPSNPDDIRQLRSYYGNMDQLEERLRAIVTRNVDLIQERGIKNKYLKQIINQEKQLVYATA